MPRQVRAVIVDPAAPGKLAIKPVESRDPDRDEIAVRVTAISLTTRVPGPGPLPSAAPVSVAGLTALHALRRARA